MATKLSTLRVRLAHRNITLAKRIIPGSAGYADWAKLDFIDANGDRLCTVRPDDLFDADGNRFEDDL